MTRFIAVSSGKGGVGKTITAVNLATALANHGANALIMDGSITTPDVHHHLGFPNTANTLNDALLKKISIHEAIYLHPTGLKVILSSEKGYAHSLDNLDEKMLDLVGKSEFVIIDGPPGLGEETRKLLSLADETLVVTAPDPVSLSGAATTIGLAESLGSTVIGVILNKVTGTKIDTPFEVAQRKLKKHIICVVPDDINVLKSVHMRQPLVCTHPESPAAVEFINLAKLFLK